MTMSHYDTLGVPPDAGADEIKTAFRRKASEHHPDKGGDDKAMAEVNRAYAVLSDPARRQQYDTTGDDAEEDRAKLVANIVMSAFAQVLTNGSEHGVLQQAKEFLRSRVASLKLDVDKHQAQTAKLKRQRDKVQRKEGVNLYHGLIDSQVSNLDDLISETEKAVTLLNEALAALDAYEANEQPAGPPAGSAAESIFQAFAREQNLFFSGSRFYTEPGRW
jgi:curved DNA-binding protein CbpA